MFLDEVPTGSPPSSYAAYDAVTGVPGGWGRVLFWSLVRAGVIGVGLRFAGQRKNLVRSSLYASGFIEFFVLASAANAADKEKT